jgi:hypothetical protein
MPPVSQAAGLGPGVQGVTGCLGGRWAAYLNFGKAAMIRGSTSQRCSSSSLSTTGGVPEPSILILILFFKLMMLSFVVSKAEVLWGIDRHKCLLLVSEC